MAGPINPWRPETIEDALHFRFRTVRRVLGTHLIAGNLAARLDDDQRADT